MFPVATEASAGRPDLCQGWVLASAMMREHARKATLARIWHEVGLFDDGTGKRVDPGIYYLVVALRAHGCPTFASCQGHLRWGTAQPWVDIKLPGAVRFGEENDESYSVVWPLEHQTSLSLVRLLDAFYVKRQGVPHHAKLVVHRLKSPGWLHISTVAYEAGYELHGHERRTWLREGLREAQSFGSFLKTQFLQNGPMVGPEPILG
jgi:hypothetical protein